VLTVLRGRVVMEREGFEAQPNRIGEPSGTYLSRSLAAGTAVR
jgi:hypothetical protein